MDQPPVISTAVGTSPVTGSRTWWLWPALVAVALGAALLVLRQFDPVRSGFYPGCTFHKLTGLNCPGCGGLRATHHLMHGRIVTALHHNALVVLGAPAAAVWAGLWLWRRWRGIPPKLQGLSPRWLWWLFAGMVAFTVLRNLPVPGLAWLSP